MTDTPATDGAKSGKAAAIDWERIEREYRAGQLSVSEIGRQCGVSHTAINKRAKAQGWTRDLTQRVRQEVSARLVSSEVSETGVRETVKEAAERVVSLVREHRADIKVNREAATKLLRELHEAIDNRAEILETIEEETEKPEGVEETKGEESARLKKRARMMAAVELPAHAQVAAQLANTLKTLIPLERQAFNLQDGAGDGDDKSDARPVPAEITENSLARLARLLD